VHRALSYQPRYGYTTGMDEILIEDKKFVSSKRAAKMTGYAKDYIGQLCREGRVPARLIGRGWFVLEAAIQDHRFGVAEEQGKRNESQTPVRPSEIPSTWESPRYEASSEELLPSINRLKEEEIDNQENGQESQYIQDSWKAWFDRFDHSEEKASEIDTEPIEAQKETVEVEEIIEKLDDDAKEEEDKNVVIPIHTVSRPLYRPPPGEFLPRNTVNLEVELPNTPSSTRRKNNRGVMRTLQITGMTLSIVVAVIAVIGSGYFDEYIISNSQVRMIAGVILYNK